jgi:hypothetical protein
MGVGRSDSDEAVMITDVAPPPRCSTGRVGVRVRRRATDADRAALIREPSTATSSRSAGTIEAGSGAS